MAAGVPRLLAGEAAVPDGNLLVARDPGSSELPWLCSAEESCRASTAAAFADWSFLIPCCNGSGRDLHPLGFPFELVGWKVV